MLPVATFYVSRPGSHLDALGHDAQRVRSMPRHDSFFTWGKYLLSLLGRVKESIPTSSDTP